MWTVFFSKCKRWIWYTLHVVEFAYNDAKDTMSDTMWSKASLQKFFLYFWGRMDCHYPEWWVLFTSHQCKCVLSSTHLNRIRANGGDKPFTSFLHWNSSQNERNITVRGKNGCLCNICGFDTSKQSRPRTEDPGRAETRPRDCPYF